MKRICVYGSINNDLTLHIDEIPQVAQSITGKQYSMRAGGKGANQAVAVAKLGANVQLISMVGYDQIGVSMVERMRRYGVGVKYIGRLPIQSGINIIIVDKNHDKTMMFFTECDSKLTVEHLEKCYDAIDNAGVLMLQLSVPISGTLEAAKRMEANGGLVLLDPSPAPAMQLPDELLQNVDIITPNERELEILSSMSQIDSDEEREAAARSLIERGVKTVIIKAGKDGAYILDKQGFRHQEPFAVKVKDTMAVGGAFNGGLAFSLARDQDIDFAVRFGQACAALTIANGGSQEAMPGYEECMDMIRGRLKC